MSSLTGIWDDGLSVIEELCMNPPKPKPGPCPGTKRGSSVKKLLTPKEPAEPKAPRPRRSRRDPDAPPRERSRAPREPKTTAPGQLPEPPAETPAEPSSPQVPSTHTGYEGPSFQVTPGQQKHLDDYREAEKALEGLDSYDPSWLETTDKLLQAKKRMSAPLRARASNESAINRAIDAFRNNREEGEEVLSAEVARETMARELKKAFSDKKIAVRVTPEGLGKLLTNGRFKTQHETRKAGPGAGYYPKVRREAELEMFGIPEDSDPKKRPVYGYVAVNGLDDPAGDSRLDMYGPVQVVLKDDVRKRTTAMVGDSLNDGRMSRPSPINDPEFWSFNVRRASNNQYERDFSDPGFRLADYAEAQIHDGVGVSDIEEVILQDEPVRALRNKLEKAGVKWRVLPPR